MDYAAGAAAAPGASSTDLIFMTTLDGGSSFLADPAGLSLMEVVWAPECTAESSTFTDVDPSTVPTLFAAASSTDHQVAAGLELDSFGLRAVVWQLEAGTGSTTSIASPQPAIGPLAAGPCAGGFGYAAITEGGALFTAEQGFDGQLLPDTGELFSLQGFNSAVTSMAVAPNADGGLFLAVSSSSQMGVYLIGCR